MLKTIIECWGGFLFKFPEISQWNGDIYTYKKEADISAIVCLAKLDEDFNDNLDFTLPEKSLNELCLMNSIFLVPVIIGVEYNDKMVVARVSNFLADKERYIYEGGAFLPKTGFNILKQAIKGDL